MKYTILFSCLFLRITAERRKTCKSICTPFLGNPKKVINPYREELKKHVIPKPFSSICLQCACCLIVADQIDLIFKEIATEFTPEKDQKIIQTDIENKINLTCTTGFKSFDWAKRKKYQMDNTNGKCETFLYKLTNGYWSKELKNKCEILTTFLDVPYLFQAYLTKTDNVTNYLCRNRGIFRDCTNVDFFENNKAEDGSYFNFLTW